jgi:hypothetical protein
MKINDIYNSWNYEPKQTTRGDTTERRSQLLRAAVDDSKFNNSHEILLVEESLEKNLTTQYKKKISSIISILQFFLS